MTAFHPYSIIIDFFYLLDLIGDCRFYAFETEKDIVVSDQQQIWNRMKKKKMRIFFKFLLCFPFYLFSDRLYCLKLLSCMHLRTLFLLMKKIAIMVRLDHQATAKIFPAAYGTFITKTMGQYAGIMLTFVAFSHVATIGWIIFKFPKDVEYYREHPTETPSWFGSHVRYYFHHLYFVVTTCSTNGYGDVTPSKDSDSELIFGMIVELVGLSILGMMWTLNNILLSSFTKQREKIEQNMKDFLEWFQTVERKSKAEFPGVFVRNLFRFFYGLFSLEADTVLYSNQYLELLPSPLSLELEKEYHEARPSPFQNFFEKYSNEMCVEIIKSCEQTSYLPGTIVVRRGLNYPGMFWITSGSINCTYNQPDQVMEELEAGDTFGSYCILDQPSRETYICNMVCLVHFLPKARLEEILQKYGVEAILFKEEAMAEFNYLKQRRNAFKTMLKFGSFL